MQQKESVDEILKDIIVRACKEYLEQPKNPNIVDKLNKAYIAERSGINPTTLGRYIDPEKPNLPNLVEVMEVLKVINKREYLLEFAKRSHCHVAQFIKEFYPTYIQAHQLESVGVEESQSNDEVLRLINEHQVNVDVKMHKTWKTTMWTLGAWILLSHIMIVWYLVEIKELLKK